MGAYPIGIMLLTGLAYRIQATGHVFHFKIKEEQRKKVYVDDGQESKEKVNL